MMTYLRPEILSDMEHPVREVKHPGGLSFTPMSGKLFRFGDFILNPEIRHLFRRRETVRLPPHAFDILLFLVQNHGTVILKEELLQTIWPGTYVEETNLAVHVSAIRRTLGEKRGENKFIETISGRGYCFVAPVEVIEANENTAFGEAKQPAGQPGVSGKIRSLAVLPFTNGSDTSSTRYLSEGITESLIESLSHLKQLKVFARSAVFQYQNQNLNLREIGFLLGADAILTGHILTIDEQLEISVELVNVFDQSHVWGMQYRCHFNDIFKIKMEITVAVTENLQLKLSKADALQLRHVPTTNSDAHKLYLKGRYLLSKKTRDGFLKGIEFFKRALNKDPNYALAYAGIADAYLLLCIHYHLPVPDTIPKAKAAVECALEIDDTLSEAHASLGHIQSRYEWKWEEAEASFKRALALNPNNSIALRWYSSILIYLCRFKEALSYQDKALELDPFSLHANTELGARFNYMGDFGKAVKQLEGVIEIEPDFMFALTQLALSYEKLGFHELALQYAERAFNLSPTWEINAFRAWVYASAGNQIKAREILHAVLDNPGHEAIDYCEIATVYASLDDKGKAFECIEMAVEEKSISICALKTDPRLDALHSDARFNELLERVGLNKA
jgi:DNA-binding winged helix-turn-helix (wHTH) protein/tetratricopeptide (TPR) repeat protein